MSPQQDLKRCVRCWKWTRTTRSRCDECAPIHAAVQRRYSAAHPNADRSTRLKREYGITLADRDALLEAQHGVCANPACVGSADVIDHDHTTGRVRGLLCGPCNLALGQAHEDPAILRGLAAYLDG